MCSAWDLSFLLRLLAQAEEQTRQLEANLVDASAADHCRSLVQQISSALKEAVSVARLMDSEGPQQPAWHGNAAVDLPRWNSEGPWSENSETVLKEQERREMCKKRKTLPKWTIQVQVSGSQAGGVPEDGYSWRTYGQKEILGTRHRRGYYRCTRSNSVGCLATKQVQRSDRDPCIFHVTYRGEHTCLDNLQARLHNEAPTILEARHHLQDQQLPLCPKTSFMEMQDHNLVSSFSFPSTPLSSFEPKNQIFSYTNPMENDHSSSFSFPFMSPPTSESNYFAVSPCQTSSYGGGTADAAFKPPHVEFDPIFSIDTSKFF
ncbi:unnamed protein product [Musa hybrid cultivar]